MSNFQFNEHGVCLNPVTLRELHIKGVAHVIIKGAEHEGLWDASYSIVLSKSTAIGPVRQSQCNRSQSQAVEDAVNIVLFYLDNAQKHHNEIPAHVVATVRSWKQGEQMSLF